MKLYTEFEVKFAMDIARCQPKLTFDEVLEQLTPIKLPSYEEINNDAKSYHEENKFKRDYPHCPYSFKDGVKWLKNKILNQNK